ncbi:MAG: DEAD/DEAH box helicase [Chlamydiales bacterium]
MSFENFGFSGEILRAVKERGYTAPTQIQTQAIPLVLQKKDILGEAQTGTGKTASFTLPLLHLLLSEKASKKRPRFPRALILAPTRELVDQVYKNIGLYGKYLPLKYSAVFGGVPIERQITKLRQGVDILIATPGRLLDHVNRKTVDISSIEVLVLDEADCMLDMGFIHDIQKIVDCLPKKRQTLLFSATFSKAIQKLAENLLCEPEMIKSSESKGVVSDQVKQVVYPIDKQRKSELLTHLITSNDWKQVLVFTRTKHGADQLSKILKQKGIRSSSIHGDKRQSVRSKTLSSFKKGDIQVLVATDVAARGLDISQLPYVVNFELPHTPSDYIHRIGRTGRAGNEGEAISLVCVDEHKLLKDIEKLTKNSISSVILPGFEVDKSIKPQPIRKGKSAANHPKKGYKRKPRPQAHKKRTFSKKY